MNKIILLLALFSCSILWTAFSWQAEQVNFRGCVVDEAGQPMMYVDLKNASGAWIMETDVAGCFQFQSTDEQLQVQLEFPGYETETVELKAEEQARLVLHKIKHLPHVYHPVTGEVVFPTESRGKHEIKGLITDASKEPLIGASILIRGTSTGTTTDFEGRFVLASPEPCADLIISYVGFEALETKNTCVGDANVFELKESARLDEVVVTGMGRRISEKRAGSTPRSFPASDVARAPEPMLAVAPPPPPPPPPPAVEEVMMMKTAPTGFADDVRTERMVIADAEASGGAGRAADGGALPKAGQLTAGEVNDFSKWDMWSDISQEDLGQFRSSWQQYADHRYTLQLTTAHGAAVVNAIAKLEDGQGNVMWQARTDAQGRAELWAHYFREVATAANGLSIAIEYDGKKTRIPNAKPFREGVNFQTLDVACREEAMVDIAFVVDATGSMGDEISYLQAELLDVIQRVKDGLPGVDLQMGSVFYRDEGEEYLTRPQAFTKDSAVAISFLEQQQAMGGGDYPEAVEAALESALNDLEWRSEASTRLLFLVLDAPPHQAEENIKRLQVAVTKAAMHGIQIIPVSCSGVDKNTEYLLRSMALATNGTYTFVTDHSGIGNAHIEPSTDSYEVEYLNDVLARLSIDRSRLSSCAPPVAEVEAPNVPETNVERNWEYYPNPTSGPLNLRFTDTEGTLYLADAQGKLLLQRPANAEFEMNLGTYPAGTYWLRHEAADGVWTQGQVLLLRR